MKIVHVIPSLEKGGAERVVVDLANAMAGRGHEVAILAARATPPSLSAGELGRGIEIRVMEEGRSRIGPYARLPSWIRRNREWLLSKDVLHCHLTFGAVVGAIASLLRKERRRPAIVGTYHSVGMPIPSALRAVHAVMLRFGDAAAFMAEDPYWASFRARNPDLVTELIANGVNVGGCQPSAETCLAYRAKAGIPEGALVMGSVGRLQAERRPDRIIETFAKVVARTDKEIHLLVAGEGPERKPLEAQAARLGLQNRVHLPGLIQNPPLAFANIDLYVTLNVGPLTGVAGLEAAVFGLPIVALQMRPDWPDDAGWIWSTTDTARLAAHIAVLFEDPRGRDALAARQRGHALKHFSVDAMVRAYEGLYAKAVRHRGGRAHESVIPCQ